MHPSKVKHTCPDIDKIKTAILQMVKDKDFLYSSASELCTMTDILEDLRSANSDLRLWGEGLLEEKEVLEEEIATLNNQIDSMVENL